MKVLLAGGTGVLGRRTLPLLLAAGHDVLVTTRSAPSADAVRAAGATPVPLDVLDRAAVAATVRALAPDAVVRLSTSIPPSSRAWRRQAWATNDRLRTEAAAALADAAVAVGARYVGESLAFAGHDHGDAWIDEDAPLAATAQTGTVVAAERAAATVTERGGVGVSLRFGMLVGPETEQTAVAVATAARSGRLALPGAPEGYVPFVHVQDAAVAVVHALTIDAGTYHVTESAPATRGEHAAALAAVVGRPVRPLPAVVARHPLLRPLARSQRVSNARLRATGWAPAVPAVLTTWADAAAALADRSTAGVVA